MAERISLAQQVALLSETAPTDFDPEDINPSNTNPSDDDDALKDDGAARAHYVDVGPSTLRQTNQASISDPKYDGKRVSRKALADADADEAVASEEDMGTGSDHEPPDGSESEVEDEEDEDVEMSVPSRVPAREEPEERPSSSPTKTPRSKLRKPARQPEVQDESENQDIASALRATRAQDRKKGKAVAQQIAVWDGLLDARIRLQKAATAVNRLPKMQELVAETAVKESLDAMLEEAMALSEDLFTLQETLLQADSAPTPPKRAKLSHPSSSSAPSPRDFSADLTTLSTTLSQYESSYHPHLVSTLSKWSSKVQAVAPNVLLPANRGSFKSTMGKGVGKGTTGLVEVVDEVLREDGERLIARTRRAGQKDGEVEEEDKGQEDAKETFDDTDFYQQLLRDVIAARGGASNAQGDEEWNARQKAQKARRKNTVDTRASKGRKLRYEVHEKLQNFMVPIPTQPGSKGGWHEEQMDELFASLLGGAQGKA